MKGVMTIDPSISLAARVLGALVFASAAVGKLRHRHELAGVVANYRIVPRRLAAPVAWTTVGLEILVAFSLASGVRLRAGAALSIALLCGFALAMAVNLARGRREIDCGCFQTGLRQRLSAGLVVRNLLLCAMVLPALATAAPIVGPLPWIDGLGAGLAAYALYLTLAELLSLRRSSQELRQRFV
jgi:uncharacterized membrane protein YphA (DoxX/SURF4 family)